MSAARTGSPRVRRSRVCPLRDLPRRSWRGGTGRRLESRIAVNGAGAVWRGSDTVLGRAVTARLPRTEYAGHPETPARSQGRGPPRRRPPASGIDQVHDYGQDGQPRLETEPAGGPPEAETGRRTLVTDRSGACLPTGEPSRRSARQLGAGSLPLWRA